MIRYNLENEIINRDYFEILPHINNESIDLVLADPPYNISRKNNFATMERYNKYKGMDFGKWDKGFNQISWIAPTVEKMANPSSIVIFNCWQNLKMIADELCRNDIKVKRVLVIKKTNPMPVNRDRLFLNSFEFALWGTKGSKWIFNRGGKYETGFFECKNNGVTKHPTEKNIDVIKDLIKVLSNKHSLILDPFAGSGTTIVACKELKRRYIASEIKREFYDMAIARVNAIPETLF